MYLEEEIYIGAEYQHNKITGKINLKRDGKQIKLPLENLSKITYRIAYWRKANSIHNWFVKECQDGVDECQQTWVSGEKLLELVDLCNKALDIINSSKLVKKTVNNSWSGKSEEIEVYDCEEEMKKMLPPTAGFFFGNTEITQWYKEDLEDTIEQLKDVNDDSTYYYQSSW